MGQDDRQGGGTGLSRRDFLKVSAAGAAAAGMAGWAPAPAMAIGHDLLTKNGDASVDYFHTTCPYCSASCGQIVAVGNVSKLVYDIYGDPRSPINKGGLCAKGAGAYQLVTNRRRLGAFEGTHPVNPVFAAKPAATVFPAQPTGWTGTAYTGSDHTYAEGVAYWRLGNGGWNPVPLGIAMDDIAARLVAARDSHHAPAASNGYNSKGVAFLGSSHVNNEQNYTYRKLIAQFGTSNTEHQARI